MTSGLPDFRDSGAPERRTARGFSIATVRTAMRRHAAQTPVSRSTGAPEVRKSGTTEDSRRADRSKQMRVRLSWRSEGPAHRETSHDPVVPAAHTSDPVLRNTGVPINPRAPALEVPWDAVDSLDSNSSGAPVLRGSRSHSLVTTGEGSAYAANGLKFCHAAGSLPPGGYRTGE